MPTSPVKRPAARPRTPKAPAVPKAPRPAPAPPTPVVIRPPLTIRVPLPPRGLSLNGRMHYHDRAELAGDFKDAVGALAKGLVAEELRPYFPASVVYIRVDVRIERYKNGLRRDFGGVVEAFKPVLDALEGIFYPNDRAVYYGRPIEWDDAPTGEGDAFLTFTGKTIEEARAD